MQRSISLTFQAIIAERKLLRVGLRPRCLALPIEGNLRYSCSADLDSFPLFLQAGVSEAETGGGSGYVWEHQNSFRPWASQVA